MFLSSLCSELGDKMALGGKVTLMGVLIVFVLLGLLVFILQLTEVFEYKLPQKYPEKYEKMHAFFKKFKIKRKNKKENDEKPADDIVIKPTITVDNSVTNDSEIVAAITGALAVVLSDEQNTENENTVFVVKKIKKLNFRR